MLRRLNAWSPPPTWHLHFYNRRGTILKFFQNYRICLLSPMSIIWTTINIYPVSLYARQCAGYFFVENKKEIKEKNYAVLWDYKNYFHLVRETDRWIDNCNPVQSPVLISWGNLSPFTIHHPCSFNSPSKDHMLNVPLSYPFGIKSFHKLVYEYQCYCIQLL